MQRQGNHIVRESLESGGEVWTVCTVGDGDAVARAELNLTANDDQAIWTKCPGWENFEPLCS